MYGKLAAGGSSEALLGLCYLAAVTRKTGYETEILDMPALGLTFDQALDIVIAKKPKYIGISSVTLAIRNAAKLADMIKKKAPGSIIILGGPHITAAYEEVMNKYSQFDIGVIGEGDQTIIELLDALEKNKDLSGVRGITYRKNSSLISTARRELLEDMNLLPMPAWDLLPDIKKYYIPTAYAVNKFPSFSIVTSRGCPYMCTFCDRSVFGNRYRTHSPEYVLSMIKDLYYNHGIRDIRINDDEFIVSKKRILEFCDLLIDSKMKISWSCLGRVSSVNKEIIDKMKKAGCWQIRFGIESGSQKVLDVLKKGIRLEQIEKAVKICKERGMKTIGFFMMGLPLETEEDLRQTIEFSLRLKLDDFKINYFAPFPGSELFGQLDKYGKLISDSEDIHMHIKPSFIPFGLSEEVLIKYNKLAFKRFYFRIRVILGHLARIKNVTAFISMFRSFLALSGYFFRKELNANS